MVTGTAVVTGADRGIGFALVRHLHRRGTSVIAGCLSPSEPLEQLGVRVEPPDVSRPQSVADFARRLQDVSLDLLVNNAGVAWRSTLDDLAEENILAQFQVNAMGTLRTTAALRHRLRDGAKVAIVTSRMGSMGDNDSGGAYGYRMSKAALNAAGVSLAHDLAQRSIAVGLVHPGFVRTAMSDGRGHLGPEQAAEGILARVDALSMETSGTFVHINGAPLPW
ncbi:MAG: SDR family oxidoreductase [Myxococcota bacterium]